MKRLMLGMFAAVLMLASVAQAQVEVQNRVQLQVIANNDTDTYIVAMWMHVNAPHSQMSPQDPTDIQLGLAGMALDLKGLDGLTLGTPSNDTPAGNFWLFRSTYAIPGGYRVNGTQMTLYAGPHVLQEYGLMPVIVASGSYTGSGKISATAVRSGNYDNFTYLYGDPVIGWNSAMKVGICWAGEMESSVVDAN